MIELQISQQSPLLEFAGRRIRLGDALEKVLAGQKDWRERNKEKVLAGQKDWRERNKEKVLAARKDWREKHPGHMREYFRRRKGGDHAAV